ncbi:hypothetical protein Y032_0025g1114 [Ancylostoma ceylanicum]|uniref:Poly(A) RNA polymerase mitochondrial-like central palm domain-containing protein n=1 Tax=Ancylostoma ceylanicum TaxID=53326 RepID=A0A016UW80_9BILA|nr:hypothetical protein Y032_0025g1114 [Ancylostoma ceylanicum]
MLLNDNYFGTPPFHTGLLPAFATVVQISIPLSWFFLIQVNDIGSEKVCGVSTGVPQCVEEPGFKELTPAARSRRGETSLVHDIPLKDLNPENVEIDDYCVYSRRTMHRIRSYAPIRIPRPSFALLERYRINARDFVDRDKEVEEMLELRRQSIRCQRMRVELRSKIGDGTDGGVKNVENEMKELSLREMDTQDGLTCEEWLPQIENDDDELLDGTIDTADVVESADTANAVEKQEFKENQPRSLICYEDFFITLKDFDRYSFKTKVDRLEKDCFTYSFDNADNFNNGYKPDMVCASCESPNHWSDACPMMTIPRIEAISHIKLEYEWVELDHVILGTYEKNRMKEHRLEKLGEMVARMRSFLEKDLKRTVRLDIFGSLVNGLGAGGSDVDICFRFDSDEQPLNVDGVEIVREISTSLQKMKGLDKVYAITGAKVPIVKFMWPKFGFEGDISYYNVLALYNTQLLKTYCAWDRRVAPIGVWVKRWAKSCDIGDASRGSLSSYAMIILLIHYLQNCEPPVLPRLQEDFRNGDVKPILVENHDVYYHKTVLEKWSENRSSVSQLFVGFLDYYARFDFETQMKSFCTVIALGFLYQLVGIRHGFFLISSRTRPSSASPHLPDHGLSQVLTAVFELVDPNLLCILRGRVEIYRITFVCFSITCSAAFPELSKEKQQNMFVINDDFLS